MNVVFIDIDGPLISTPQLMADNWASMNRSLFNQNAIIYVNSICNLANAKIVTNSSHNYMTVPRGLEEHDLRQDLIRHGIKEEYFHEDWRTRFGDAHNITRLYGLQNWLNAHEVTKWVSFDDMKYTTHEELIHVSFDDGIAWKDYEKALNIFGVKHRGMFGL